MIRGVKIFGVFILMGASLLMSAASETKDDFLRATQLSESGQHREAILLYKDILKKNVTSAELEFNLGTCYLMTDSIASAILHLERARKMKPNRKSTINQIERARERIEEAVIPVTPFFLSVWINRLSGAMSPTLWSILSILMLWCAVISFTMLLQKNPRISRKLKLTLIIICGGIFMLSLLMSVIGSQRVMNQNYAVLMTSQVELKVGPDEMSTTVQNVFAGEKMRLIQHIEDWYQVELLNRDTGWILKRHFERI